MAAKKKDKFKCGVGLLFLLVGLVTCIFLKHVTADTAIVAGFLTGIGYIWVSENS
jgi:hypothetical protein